MCLCTWNIAKLRHRRNIKLSRPFVIFNEAGVMWESAQAMPAVPVWVVVGLLIVIKYLGERVLKQLAKWHLYRFAPWVCANLPKWPLGECLIIIIRVLWLPFIFHHVLQLTTFTRRNFVVLHEAPTLGIENRVSRCDSIMVTMEVHVCSFFNSMYRSSLLCSLLGKFEDVVRTL